MEIKTEIKINREELIELIKNNYKVDGDVEFIIKEDVYKSGYTDEGQQYSKRYIFDSVKVTTKRLIDEVKSYLNEKH
jgi:hypothetical protein